MELKGRTEIYSLSPKRNTPGLEQANSGYRVGCELLPHLKY